jgi:hypothetical protein
MKTTMMMMTMIACRLSIQPVSLGEGQAMNEHHCLGEEICKGASRTSDPSLDHQSEQLVSLRLP